MESSDCAAALDPSVYHGHGANELDRFLAGARDRDELALLITTMGNVNDRTPRRLGATADASIPLPGIPTIIYGARLPAGAAVSLADGLDSTDRDLALRLRNAGGPQAAWWGLGLSGVDSWRGSGGPPVRYAAAGTLAPILIDGLGQPVVAAWTHPDASQRWYIVPDACDWHGILEWLVQRALPRYVPGALRRARSPLALDPRLQTPAESAARRALDELEASYAEQHRELERRLEGAKAQAEPIRNGLLYGTGLELEGAVAAVLEAAGLAVVRVDELLGETSSADLLVSWAGRRWLIEVKSASGSASESLVGQLENHLRTWPRLRPTEPVDWGVLVVNHQHRLEPDARSVSVYTRPEFVAALTVPVLSTLQLFDWWRASDWAAIQRAVLADASGSGDGPVDSEPPSPTILPDIESTDSAEPDEARRGRGRRLGRRARTDPGP